jgi:hypothetical protein
MIKNRILTAAAMPLLAVLCLVSCGKENIPEVKEPAKAVSWTPNAESLTISVGETATISGETVFDDGTKTEQEALCTSKDESIVFANGGYSIVGLAPGTAYVSARVAYYAAGDISAPIAVFQKDIQVTVKGDGAEVSALELSPAEVTLKRGEEVTLKIYASYPDGTKREISPKVCKWSVTDDGEQHIIYDSDGKVRGMQGTGETILTAEYTENGVTVKGSSKIIVND